MKEEKLPENYIAQTDLIACLLTFSGGFVDCYTYIERGQTLSAGQTGNIIFFSSSLINGNLLGMINRGSTILAFIVGIIFGVWIQSRVRNRYWRIFEMIPLLIVTFIIGFLPTSAPNYLVVPATSFGMAMQGNAFQKVQGLGYSNVFTSGNLKKTIFSWGQVKFFNDKSKEESGKAYLSIVVSFMAGAIISAVVQKYCGIRAIWLATLILIITNAIYFIRVEKLYKDQNN